jgi:hypothetical protein
MLSIAQNMSRDGSVGISTGWTARVRFLTVQDFYFLHRIQTGSGAHPASYPKLQGGSVLGVNRPRSEANHLPPSSAEVKNSGAIPPHPHTSSKRGA